MPTNSHTAGILPMVNDLVAIVAVVAVYLVRIGTVAEGVEPTMAYVPLYVTTDLLLPLAGGAWLLLIPSYQIYTRLQE